MHGGPEQIHLEAWRMGLPFFKLLKHQENFAWTPEADQALAQLKDFLSKPLVLTAPCKMEQLLLYLAATTHVVSTAIVVERQEDSHTYPVQRPVYFIIEVISESKAEATVRSAHHLAEATTLLLGVLDLRRHRLPARRHLAEPRCYWKDLQVGSRTRRPQH
jgi:hypothetical protein